MGVPTMYAYLLEHAATRMDDAQRAAARCDMYYSGSAITMLQ